MRVDTHTHLLLTKEAMPDWKSINFYIDVARIKGLDVLCFTEHLDAVNYTHLLNSIFCENILRGEITQEGVVRLPNDLIITSGAEISLRGGADIGLHTKVSVIKQLNREKGYYTLDALVDTVANLTDEYVVIAHHLYRPGKWIHSLEEKVDLLDSIELPAKDISQREKYESLSVSLNKPFVAGSDAHTWIQIGVGQTIIEEKICFNASNFKKAIRSNALTTTISPEAERLVSISSAYRKHLIA